MMLPCTLVNAFSHFHTEDWASVHGVFGVSVLVRRCVQHTFNWARTVHKYFRKKMPEWRVANRDRNMRAEKPNHHEQHK